MKEFYTPYSTSGLTNIYVLIRTGLFYVRASDGVLISATAANRTAAAVYLADSLAPGEYLGDIPTGTPRGYYTYYVFKRIGASPDKSDPVIAQAGSFAWDGISVSSAFLFAPEVAIFPVTIHTQSAGVDLAGVSVSISKYFGPVVSSGLTDAGGLFTAALETGNYMGVYSKATYTTVRRYITVLGSHTETVSL